MPGEIVKVQRPISDPSAPWLVFDSRKRRTELLDPPPKSVVEAMGTDAKCYLEAVWTGARWAFGARVRDQAW